ncbi:hypothetical protein Ddye_016618 [Dipteronia dyeriana]|uniref:Flavin-containing monooxygenase n=1 Tax=Dipteronia dyeriana TaxID=168575 RepID=A0AAD9U801_9ROSI|nr:hypothetical protein Ddye_016618 [Dipteronia dyeriana]
MMLLLFAMDATLSLVLLMFPASIHGQESKYIATIIVSLNPFKINEQVVILIGDSASAVDICRDIAGVAKEVYVASRSVADETYEKYPGYDNMWHYPMIESACEDGNVVFQNGNVVLADVILHCTGYFTLCLPFPGFRGNFNSMDIMCYMILYKIVMNEL